MADAKIITYGEAFSATTDVVPDNQSVALDIESVDGKDYIQIDTTDSAEKLILSGGGATVEIENASPTLTLDNSTAEDIEDGRESKIEFTGLRSGGEATALGSLQFRHHGTSNDNKSQFYLFTNDNSDASAAYVAIHVSAAGRVGIGQECNDNSSLQVDTSEGDIEIGRGDNSIISFQKNGASILRAEHGSGDLQFDTGGSNARLHIDASGEICTGASTANPGSSAAAGSLHIYTGDTSHTQVHADWDELVIEGATGNRSGLTIMSVTDGKGGVVFSDPGNAQAGMLTYDHNSPQHMDITTEAVSCLKLYGTGKIVPQKGAIQYHQGTGSDTATTQAVYLADTNATLIIDFANGNVGDVTLAAGVTAVKFFNVPADGTSATVTARITQDSSTRTIDYSDSAVTCYSDGGSSAVTGEIKFSGGVHHTQSTGSGDVDIVSFTSIPTGSTFNIYAAVIGQDFS